MVIYNDHDGQVYRVDRGRPVRDMAVATYADTLIATWVARFRVPEVITSDRGPQFTSQAWSVLSERLHQAGRWR